MAKKTIIENLFDLDRQETNTVNFKLSNKANGLTNEWISALKRVHGAGIPEGITDAQIIDKYSEAIWIAGLAATMAEQPQQATGAVRRGGRRKDGVAASFSRAAE